MINDVVCIRINGQLFCYRYIKPVRSFTHFNANDSFILVPGFLSEELEDYMTQIHASEHVLSVLDGKLLSLNDEKINNLFMFCIENEVSYMPNGALSFGFSVYCFQDHNIVNIDPGETPFLSLNNAFYYYKRSCGLTSNSILLYNRYELEMVKDHCDLLFLSRIG